MIDVAQTQAGAVRGQVARGVLSFRGIPYGDDTSGIGRFRRARPPRAWAGVRDCCEYGPSCPQVRVGQMMGRELPPEVETSRAIWNHERRVGENCLVVNVWTPAVDGSVRPVLVWLHGGGLSVGSASWPLYDFTNLAGRNDAVVVSINHRVGILGFMDVGHVDEEFADSGNVGILDLVSALEWVRDNIAGFGGDPENVTIFGESGGGSKVTCLLGMPEARGLFRRAFAMSGALLRARTPELARRTADHVLDQLGVVGDSDALQKLDADELVAAEIEVFRTAGPLLAHRPRAGFGPTHGPSLPQHPVDAVRAGSAAGVDVVIGCTTHEGLLTLTSPEIWFGGDDVVRQHITTLMGEHSDRLFEDYRAARPEDSLLMLLVLMASDRLMRIPHIRYAEALLAGRARSWMYLYDFRQPLVPGVEPLAGHGADMPYVFDNVELAPSAQVAGADAVATAMSGALVSLARMGDPNHRALPAWATYSLPDRPTMIFDAEPRVELDPFSGLTAAWDGIDVGDGLG